MTMTTFSQDIKGDLWDGHNPQLRGEWLGPSLSAESLSDGRCLSLKCHNASVIRTSLARPSRSHTVNTSWALSQLWVWVTAERPFVFFFFLSFVLGWAAEGPTEMTAPREKQFPQAKSHKKYIYICTEVKTVAEITSSHIENAEKVTLMDFGVSLVVVSLQMIYNLRFVWLQVSLQARAFICSRRIKQYFSRNNVVLSDSLHLWALSSRCPVICSIIKWSIQRKLAAYNKTPHFNSSVPSVSSFAK